MSTSDDVYIGSGAQIRSGTPEKPIVIGAGAFIAMGAIVVKDVPPGVRVAGNPARPMDQRPGGLVVNQAVSR